MKIAGIVRVPGDKSITHRALMLAALARGTSYLGGALTSLDAGSTARVLRRLGVGVSPLRAQQTVEVRGRSRFQSPAHPLDCGNSGTTARLLLGLLAGHRFAATLTGDSSLRRRPMRRVTGPLGEMGARVTESNGDGLPLTIRGGPLRPIRYRMPVSSAQVKSALLFAGVTGKVPVEVYEPGGRSRDHTERMLQGAGFSVSSDDGWIRFAPDSRLAPFEMQVPGDISSAAFLIATALLAEAGELTLASVGINPTRTGLLAVLERMGAHVIVVPTLEEQGEPVGDLMIRPAHLRGTEVFAREIPGLIDEIPVLAALATRATGTTVFRQAGELRVKESDRLELMAANIRALGGRADVHGEDLWVEGNPEPPRGRVVTAGDHRLAMAFQVLGTLPGSRVRVDDPRSADVSFPGFARVLRSVQARRSRG
ncbi:MAG TPA: 3-phosphoshikimate 1-carboxyvinyltransferase [Gemmatimonadales bacterium]|nr:3-phosphoshikimate 1-carboxyvinyltransferase [Gemmatimonadales bacterium]